MSGSPCPLESPPPRPPAEGRVQTRSSGSPASPCALCSPPMRPPMCDGLRSPMDGRVKAVDDPIGLIVESWCSPTLVSPAGRPCSVMRLEQTQSTGPVDLADPFLEEQQWDLGVFLRSGAGFKCSERNFWVAKVTDLPAGQVHLEDVG